MIPRSFLSVLVLIPLLLGALQAHASVDAVAKDFKDLSGVVIMPVQDEFIIDQDASNGVVAGDLFSVIQTGTKIVHPVTNKVLGTLDEVKGLLVVTRVRSGYSYVRPVGPAQGIGRGDIVRRYGQVSAALWDYTGQGEAFFAELKAALPHLNWLDYAVAQANRPQKPGPPTTDEPALIFILRNDGLDVRGIGFQTIHAYPAPLNVPSPATPMLKTSTPVPATSAIPASGLEERLQALEQKVQQGDTTTAPYRLEAAPQKMDGNVAYEVAYSNFVNVGDLPGKTLMADFSPDGNRLLLATTDGGKIEIFAVTETLQPLAAEKPSQPGKLLSLHWWQPQPSGPLYLAATQAVDQNVAFGPQTGKKISGSIFEFTGSSLVPVRQGLNYLLGSFDRNGDGIKETLLAQEFDRDVFFGPRIYELQSRGDKIERVDLGFDLPGSFPVQGSTLVDLTGDGRQEAVYVFNRVLYIYDGNKKLYESAKTIGGSQSVFTYAINPGAADQLTTTASFEVAPTAADLDGDGRPELVAVAAEGSAFRAPGIGPGISKSWLHVLKYQNGRFVRGSMGGELDVPLQGLTVAKNRALLVASQPGSLFGETGNSTLLALPLQTGN